MPNHYRQRHRPSDYTLTFIVLAVLFALGGIALGLITFSLPLPPAP